MCFLVFFCVWKLFFSHLDNIDWPKSSNAQQTWLVFDYGKCDWFLITANVTGFWLRQMWLVFDYGRCDWFLITANVTGFWLRQMWLVFDCGRCDWFLITADVTGFWLQTISHSICSSNPVEIFIFLFFLAFDFCPVEIKTHLSQRQ